MTRTIRLTSRPSATRAGLQAAHRDVTGLPFPGAFGALALAGDEQVGKWVGAWMIMVLCILNPGGLRGQHPTGKPQRRITSSWNPFLACAATR
jgi:hypothetical protein